MMWQVIKPHYWMLDRRIRGTHRIWIVLSITLLALGIEWLYNNALRDQLNHLDADSVFTGILLLGLVGAALIMLLDINHLLYQLFESPELEILMANPVPRWVIYTLKLAQSGRTLLLSGIFLAGVLVLTGIERGVSLTFYPLALVVLLGILTIIAASVMSLVLIICRIIPPRHLRSGTLIVFTILPLVIILIQADFSVWFSDQTRLHTLLADLLLNPVPLAILVVLVAALTLLWSFQVFTHTFYEGRTRYQVIYKSTTRPSARPSRRWLAKEWKTVRRNTRLLISFLQPLSFSLILLLPWLRSGSISAGLQQIAFWFLMLFSCQLMVTVPFVGVELLAREGHSFGLIRTQPVAMNVMLRVKFWIIWLPQMFIWLICVLLLGVVYRLLPWQVMMILGMSSIGLAFMLSLSLALAAMQVDFNARRIPRGTSLILMGISILWALGLLVLAAYGIWYLFPTSEASLVLTALNIHLSPEWWLPVTAFHASLLLVTYILWQKGVYRLDHWEINDKNV